MSWPDLGASRRAEVRPGRVAEHGPTACHRDGRHQALSTTALRALEHRPAERLTSNQLQSLTSGQITALTTDQVQGLTTANLNALTTDELSKFSSTQVKAPDDRADPQPDDGQPERPGYRAVRAPDVRPGGGADDRAAQQAGNGRPAFHHHRRPGGSELRITSGPPRPMEVGALTTTQVRRSRLTSSTA